jgi:thioredoxin-like negative regulator of GroEL
MMNFSCIEEVSEWSFSQRVLRSVLPVLVVVWADSRGAEEGFLKLVEEWAPQARGRMGIFRLNVERSSGLAERCGIPLAPGLALFSRGVMCYQFIGEASRRELDDLLVRASTLGVCRESGGAPGGRIVEPPQVVN